MPVQETTEVAKAVTFNWPQVTAVLGGISMFLTFIGSVVWKYIDSKDKSTKKDDTEEKEKKMDELKAIVATLTTEYEVLQVQMNHLQVEVGRIDSATAKEIEKLEGKIDKLIDMMIKLVSEDD